MILLVTSTNIIQWNERVGPVAPLNPVKIIATPPMKTDF